MREQAGAVAVYGMHRDHLSSVKVVTKPNGNEGTYSRYQPYGVEAESGSGAPAELKSYIGERLDPTNGLLYLNARCHDPKLASFLQANILDPLTAFTIIGDEYGNLITTLDGNIKYMTRTISHQKLRQDLLEARLRPKNDPRAYRIYRATRRILDEGEVYFVLTETPEQTSDVFRILVDDKAVVAFELDRSGDAAVPIDPIIYSVEEYRKAIGTGLAQLELCIATELAREALV